MEYSAIDGCAPTAGTGGSATGPTASVAMATGAPEKPPPTS